MVLLATGCGASDAAKPAATAPGPGPGSTSSTGPASVDPTGETEPDPSAEIVAAALRQLVTKNHTYGEGPPPFTEYLVQSHLDPQAGNPNETERPSSRSLTDAERSAIEASLAPLGPVRFIDDASKWRTDDLRPVVEGAVILGVGEPVITRDTALVAVSLWCGGLCGTWLTYRVHLVGGHWEVAGTEGPIAIS